ncbi:response regulator [Coraliomargarita sp. SDUM461004]|uniref:Response regulator n=1 Tax=Thalassobacterium sedimentorum TaxID=3041258 RepID=A0ABU1AG62_9BACT|nr:response regulator [Coraliomargarita sp. SDUM461004]MDQ8193817.1 response regulator [Coraliomargarita sp. SDUM461004]
MKKVLVVDDDIVMFRLFQVQVKRAGCEGFFFRDGKSALEQLEKVKPDLAVLDYNLPDLDGAELYQRIRETPGLESIPIVFVTGSVQDDDLKAIESLGANAVLSKPFSPRILQNLIKQLLNIG